MAAIERYKTEFQRGALFIFVDAKTDTLLFWVNARHSKSKQKKLPREWAKGGVHEEGAWELFKILLLSKVDSGDFLWWIWNSSEFRRSRFLGGAAGSLFWFVAGGLLFNKGKGCCSWGALAKPRTLKLVAVAKSSSNSLLGTRTSPQYMNCKSRSKCTGLTSFKNTTGWFWGLNRVNMDLKSGLQAHKTNLWASKTRSPHQIVTSVSNSCCNKSSAKAKKLTPWSFHLRMYSSSILDVIASTSDVAMWDSKIWQPPHVYVRGGLAGLCHHSNSTCTRIT